MSMVILWSSTIIPLVKDIRANLDFISSQPHSLFVLFMYWRYQEPKSNRFRMETRTFFEANNVFFFEAGRKGLCSEVSTLLGGSSSQCHTREYFFLLFPIVDLRT